MIWRVLVVAYAPTNILMAMAALSQVHPHAQADLLIVTTSSKAASTMQRMARAYSIIGRINAITWEEAQAFESVPRIFLSSPLYRLCAALPARWATRHIYKHFPKVTYDAIYYPHDVVGSIVDLVATAWPDAEMLCYGDAFGNFYQKHVHLGLLGIRTRPHPFLRSRSPEIAAAVLPVDQSGQFLNNVRLQNVSRDVLIQVMNTANSAFPELSAYLDHLSDMGKGRQLALQMTENHAEGGFISLETEVAMYGEAIRKYVPIGSAVVVKPHPGETLQRAERLTILLGDDYDIIGFDERFHALPVEMMSSFIAACEPCICMSYPALSLLYLFGKRIINPKQLEPGFIERWFKPETWVSFRNSTKLYVEPACALANWDGTGPLWRGNNS